MHFEHPEISHHLMDCPIKQSSHQFHKIFFRISKCLGCNGEKSLEDKKRNEYSLLDKYICKYIYLYYMRPEWLKIKIIQSVQYCSMVTVVFPTSGFPYLILCPKQCKWNVATTYLPIRTLLVNFYICWFTGPTKPTLSKNKKAILPIVGQLAFSKSIIFCFLKKK